jgi:glycosyltransferase involved in cell wall biosynthesis
VTEGVFIAMPVYRGAEVIEETIRSILAQTYDDFRLVMSVDGADDPTIEICRKFEDDPRIDVVVQENRLGWPGNFNWLVETCDREYFCYWQQDDLASTGYLENLRREMLARPDAAIAYTDVQWFGARFDREASPSIEGDPLSRVMQHIEAIRYEPLRGLMRSSMLPQGGEAIPVTEDESCQEEFVFLTQMAAAGAFVRVDLALYFKRLHTNNAFVRWAHFPDWRRRRGWLSMGAGMYRIARDCSLVGDQLQVLAQVADRLAVVRHGRGHFYAPPQTDEELARFVRDLVAFAEVSSHDLGTEWTRPGALSRPIHEAVLGAIDLERTNALLRDDMTTQLLEGDVLTVEAADDRGTALLGYGWSHTEPWGVWTDGLEATLRIPAPPDRKWRATLLGQVYGTSGPVRLGHGTGHTPLSYTVADPGDQLIVVVEADGGEEVVRLDLADARSPEADGVSSDRRVLCFGLRNLAVELI